MKLSHIFKVIPFLLLPFFLLAQYPNNPVKSRLGWQTTGDGLVYRGSGAPAYSPGTLFNAWMYLDTTNYALYMYRNFQWTKLPLVNNGLTLDGSYVQLGGTLVENTTVERSTYALDLGKKSGSNNGYLSFYGTDPHYVGILTTKDGTESGLTIGNKLWGFEVDDSDHTFQLNGTRFGFDATYLGTLGVSQFKMDSTRFYIRGLPTYSTHAAADADLDTYGMYQITDGRAIYARTGSANKVSPNIQDNGTAVSILNSKPFQLGQWTTAGRPTGTTGYEGYNITGNGKEWYQGSRWAYALESTFARGTAMRLLFSDANGQATDDAAYYVTASQMYVNGIKIGLGNGAVSQNMAIGFESMNAAATGNFNTGVGYRTLYSLLGGTHNSAFGRLALFALTSGAQNMAFGAESLSSCTTCQSNVAVGYNALKVNNKDFNVAIGRNALVASTGSDYNTAIGDRAMVAQSSNTLGRNVAIGAAALASANTSLTVAVGESALSSLTSGTGHVAIGRLAGASETTNSNKLHIANTNTKSLIYGDFSTDQVIINATWPPTLKSSVALELISTNKGFLPPVMTNAQRTAISSAATGLQVFSTDANEGMYVKLAAGWKRFLVDGDAATTWLKTELEAGRDVDITGASSTDFKLRSNTRVQFDGKVKFGSDSSMYYDPPGKALVMVGNAGFQPSFYQANTYNSFTRAHFTEYDFRAMYGAFSSVNGYNFTHGLSESRIGTQWPLIHKIDSSALLNGWGITNVYGSDYGGVSFQHVFQGGADENEFYFRSRSNIYGRAALTVYSQPFAVDVFTVSNLGKVKISADSTFKFDPADDLLQLSLYGDGVKEAGDVSKTQSNYIAGFATDGTVLDLERKRDTTIFVTANTDYDFSAAVTTAQIASRYNRIIIHMTLTSGVGADKTTTLHTPDANLMQCEILIRGTDNTGTYDNEIAFGTNNAISSDGTNASGYTLAQGQGLHVRVVYNGSAYKYIYY